MRCRVYVGGRYNTTLGKGAGTFSIFSEGSKVWEDTFIFDYNGKSSMIAEAIACERALEKATYMNFKDITVCCSSKNLANLINTGKTEFSVLTPFISLFRSYNQKLLHFSAECSTKAGISHARSKSEQTLNKYTDIKGDYTVYADGCLAVGKYYGGVVITKKDRIIYESRFSSNNLLSSGKIAGTMLAVVEGLLWCVNHNIKSVVVVCSDEIVCKWASGTCRAKKENGKKFVSFIKSLDIEYKFVKDYIKVCNNLNRAKCIAERGYAYDYLDRQ